MKVYDSFGPNPRALRDAWFTRVESRPSDAASLHQMAAATGMRG